MALEWRHTPLPAGTHEGNASPLIDCDSRQHERLLRGRVELGEATAQPASIASISLPSCVLSPETLKAPSRERHNAGVHCLDLVQPMLNDRHARELYEGCKDTVCVCCFRSE